MRRAAKAASRPVAAARTGVAAVCLLAMLGAAAILFGSVLGLDNAALVLKDYLEHHH